MPVKRAKSKAARMAAHAAMVCGAMAITTIAARFMHSAQDARPAFGERQAYAQILSRGQRLFENWNGLGDQTTEKNSVEIVVPADVGTERFVGEIGSRDEADFRSQDGSGNMMRVTSLDDDLKTLIAVRVQGKSEVGTAYSLRRQDDGGLIGGRGLYELKWSAQRNGFRGRDRRGYVSRVARRLG